MDPQDRLWSTVIGLGVVAMLGIGFAFGKSCARPPTPPRQVGIDAGPGDEEIRARAERVRAEEEERIRVLEEVYRSSMVEFDSAQKAEYYEVRAQGRDAVAAWLSGFSRGLRAPRPDGGA